MAGEEVETISEISYRQLGLDQVGVLISTKRQCFGGVYSIVKTHDVNIKLSLKCEDVLVLH
jgi:hypothetical protein